MILGHLKIEEYLRTTRGLVSGCVITDAKDRQYRREYTYEEEGGDTVKLHQLRHAFCSHALMSGIDPRTVQKWMGHKDLKTTLRYAHVSPDHEKAAIQMLRYQPGTEQDSFLKETA